MDRLNAEEIIDKYAGTVFNIAYRFTGNSRDAEDLSQEAFIKLLKNYDSGRVVTGRSLKSWFYKVVRNLYVNLVTRDRFNRNMLSINNVSGFTGKELSERISDGGCSPEQEMQRKEEEESVQNVLKTLPGEYRMAVILRDIRGMSYREIGHIMGCGENTVKTRIYRGRMLLAERIGDEQSPGRKV